MNKPVQTATSIAIETKIYVFGDGYIQVYDTLNDRCRTISEYNSETAYMPGAATSGKYAPQKIYLFGHNALYFFDPQTETLDNLPFPNHIIPEDIIQQYPNSTFRNHLDGFKVAIVDDLFYLIGGGTTGENQYGSSISFKVDYRYVPLGYDADPQEGSGGFKLFFTVAGVVVAVVFVVVAGLMVYRFRHVPARAAKI
jgi:hypothetical protein